MLASSSTMRMLAISGLRLRGDLDHERRAAPRGGVHLDRAVVVGDDALDDREPEPGAVRLGGEPGHEQLRALLLVEAWSVVADGEEQRVAVRGHGHAHVAGPGSAGRPRGGGIEAVLD